MHLCFPTAWPVPFWGGLDPEQRHREDAKGRKRIAQTLTRAGLRRSASTVGRIFKDRGRNPERPTEAEATAPAETGGENRPTDARTVTAKRPNHVWHIDLTGVPTGSGCWAPWLPFALPQCWPFCWQLTEGSGHARTRHRRRLKRI